MDKLDLTTECLSALLDVVEGHWENISPFNMTVQRIQSPEANCKVEENFLSDHEGLLRYQNPREIDFPICALNYDLIIWQQDQCILEYRDKINDIYPQANISSTHYMDKDGFMQWHTNRGESPERPRRIYVTFNKELGSFFKYVKDGIVCKYDEPIGWYAKVFNVETEIPHCIYANGPRWSLGMRF